MLNVDTNTIIEEIHLKYFELTFNKTIKPQNELIGKFAEQYIIFSKGINNFLIKDFTFTRSTNNSNTFFLNDIMSFNMKFNRHMNTALFHEGSKNPHSLFFIHSESIFDDRFDFSNIDISIEIKDKNIAKAIKSFILAEMNNLNYDFKQDIKSSMICFSTIKSILKTILRDTQEDHLDNLYPLFNYKYDDSMLNKFNEISEILSLQFDVDIQEDINNLNEKIQFNKVTHINKSKFIC